MPTKSKLTPWFPETVDPARVGIYEVEDERWEAPNYRYWSGRGWSCTYSQPSWRAAAEGDVYRAGYSRWRGLAKNPASSAA